MSFYEGNAAVECETGYGGEEYACGVTRSILNFQKRLRPLKLWDKGATTQSGGGKQEASTKRPGSQNIWECVPLSQGRTARDIRRKDLGGGKRIVACRGFIDQREIRGAFGTGPTFNKSASSRTTRKLGGEKERGEDSGRERQPQQIVTPRPRI